MPRRLLTAILKDAEKTRALPEGDRQETKRAKIRGEIRRFSDRTQLQVLAALYPFSLVCGPCDVEELDSLANAKKTGWVEIECDDAPSWNFIGTCPRCAREEKGMAKKIQRQRELF